MEIGKILDALNIPAAVVHLNGRMNVYHVTKPLYELYGFDWDHPDRDERDRIAAALLEDETSHKIPLDGGKTLLVPNGYIDVATLFRDANRDELTKTYNRRGLYAHYEQLRARVGDEGITIVLCLDANKFKEVNDKYGHDVGDKVLIAMTQRLRRVLKHDDLVARIGGDEFIAIAWMPNRETVEQFQRERLPEINAAVCRDYAIDDGRVELPLSFALGVVEHEGALPPLVDDLINQADRLMYADKGLASR